MGFPSVEEGLGYLTDAGIRAQLGYQGYIMTQINTPVAAVNLMKDKPTERTLLATVCGPKFRGAHACEELALQVATAWTAKGAACTAGRCEFDGQSALFQLEVQGTWAEA